MSDPGNPLQSIEATAQPDSDNSKDEGTIDESEQTANSLRCDDCCKIFRNLDYAQIHAHKSGHVTFSESTETLKPLTEEEKKAKLAELQQRMAEKREQRRLQEIQERKESERIRRKAGQELIEVQERLKEKEMRDALDEKKREKIAERNHKARILAEIERDRQDRLARQNRNVPAVTPPKPVTPQPLTSSATSARLQIRGATHTPLVNEFPADALLRDVMTWLSSQGVPTGSLSTMFPRRVLGVADLDKSLRDLDLVPSAALNFVKS